MKKKRDVFIISKPIVPPWNDSGKNIAKELVTHGEKFNYRVLTTADFSFADSPHIRYERIYPSGGTFKAGLRQNLKVMFTGLRPKGAGIYHYFFAPNKLSATAGKVQRTLARVKTVQTFSSRPATYVNIQDLIFTDKVIVLSKDTRDHLLNAGVDPRRVVHIPPGITPPAPLSEAERDHLRQKYHFTNRRVVLFPGDYEFSDAATQVAEAAPLILESSPDSLVVFACRAKTEHAQSQKRIIANRLSALGDQVRFLDEIDDMARFVGLADALLLPQNNLYAKMDIPLVLLEAMAHQVPLILANAGPLKELIASDAAIGVVNAAELAAATTRLLQSRQESVQRGEAGLGLVKNTYNALNMAKAVETLYEELLER